MADSNFPKYFLVDNEIYVKVYFDGDSLVAVNDLGNPYKPYKAMADGKPISKNEFDAGTAKRKKEYPNIISPIVP